MVDYWWLMTDDLLLMTDGWWWLTGVNSVRVDVDWFGGKSIQVVDSDVDLQIYYLWWLMIDWLVVVMCDDEKVITADWFVDFLEV